MTENNRPFIRIGPDNSGDAELQRRSELRRNYLVPIYFMHTSNVPKREVTSAFLGVQDALTASGQTRQLINFGSQKYGAGDYSSPDWYVEKAIRNQELCRNAGYGLQVDAREVNKLFASEPYQNKPHWEVLVINDDLSVKNRQSGYLNYVFGLTDISFPSSVQSVARLIKDVKEGELRDLMIRRLLRHEVGHMFRLPLWNRGNVEEKLGLHCTNVCTMRQGMSIQEWAQETIEERNKGVHFCADCRNDLTIIRQGIKPLPNK
jgi:predicted Zn-dependent protease